MAQKKAARAMVPHLGGDNHPSEQQGQQRVDDADVVPRHTNIRERPERGPVTRAGVEQTVGRPTQCGGEVQRADAVLAQEATDGCGEPTAYGDRHQGVGEVSVVVKR